MRINGCAHSFRSSDVEDLRQEIVRAVTAAWPSFDAHVAAMRGKHGPADGWGARDTDGASLSPRDDGWMGRRAVHRGLYESTFCTGGEGELR